MSLTQNEEEEEEEEEEAGVWRFERVWGRRRRG
jgi:hypothetical protein